MPKPRAPAGPAGPDPLVGRVIGRCKIVEKVGLGRTAVVYRAQHEGLGRDVALKILLPEVLQQPEVVAKFEQEARAIARLDHPNVLKIYDVVSEGDVRGIVMEFLEGESVLEYVQHEGRVEPVDALRVVRQAAAGLQAAHAKGIIHRDVKPQNLVILEDGTVKLVDFGLATATDSDLTGQRIGTPHYMAPEACEAKPVEPASDVYSLGITLYHLLVGQPPFAGMSIKEILAAHIAGKPLQPESIVKGLGKPLCDLVRSMTKRDPITRMGVDEVIRTLDQIGGEDLVRQRKLKSRSARHRRVLEGRARSKSAPVVPLMIAAAVVVGLVIFLLSRSGSGPQGTQVSGGGKSTPTPPPSSQPSMPSTPVPSPEVPPTKSPEAPPAKPTESEAQKKEREEAEKQAELARRTERSEKALEDTANFARVHWEDKASVVREYRLLARTYSELPIGKLAKRRADGIEKGEIHPHPDRSYATKTAVDQASDSWKDAKVEIDKAITAMRYDQALAMVPANVEDPEGKLESDIVFWRELVRDLADFLPAVQKESETLKGDARKINTPKGMATITRFSTAGPQVQTGSEVLDLRWVDIAPADIAELARKAFAGKTVREQELLASFAWAHRLREVFFQAAITVKTQAAMSGVGKEKADRMLQRADERFPR